MWVNHIPWNVNSFPSSEVGRIKTKIGQKEARRIAVGGEEMDEAGSAGGDPGGGERKQLGACSATGGLASSCLAAGGLVAVDVSASADQTRVVGLAGPNPTDPELAIRLPEWFFDSGLDARTNASTLALRFSRGAELKLPL